MKFFGALQQALRHVTSGIPAITPALLIALLFLSATGAAEHASARSARIFGWGSNMGGQLGTEMRAYEVKAPTRGKAVEVVLQVPFSVLNIVNNGLQSCLLRSDFTVWCWGGDLAPGASVPARPPFQVKGLPPVHSLSVKREASLFCARPDAGVWCWAIHGVIGSTVTEQAARLDFKSMWLTPEGTGIDYDALSNDMVDYYPSNMVDSFCSVTSKGEAWCWGNEYRAAIPVKESQRRTAPVKIPLPGPVKDIFIGSGNDCAVLADNTVWCWREGLHPEPKARDDIKDAVQVLIGALGIGGCYVGTDGTVWCWDIGDAKPQQVMVAADKPLTDVIKIGRGNEFKCALRKDTTVWCWGATTLGDPEVSSSGYAIPVKNEGMNGKLKGATDIAVGETEVLVVAADEGRSEAASKPVDPSMEILNAIQSENFVKAEGLLAKKPDLKVTSPLARDALITAAERGQSKLVKPLVTAFRKVGGEEATFTAALQAVTCRCKLGLVVSPEVVQTLLDAGADVNAEDSNGKTPLVGADAQPKEVADILFAAGAKKSGRIFLTQPPDNLGIDHLPVSTSSCTSGKAVFDKAGEFKVHVPDNCDTIMVKAWGAGGGTVAVARNLGFGLPGTVNDIAPGGAGGFSTAILSLPRGHSGEVTAMVGGAGTAPGEGAFGEGGYNGGGNGGLGMKKSSGGGGGGRTEIKIGGKSVLVAGGGAGAAHLSGGGPGGGDRTPTYLAEVLSLMPPGFARQRAQTDVGQPGDDGRGGKPGNQFDAPQSESCVAAPQSGGEKQGGNGGGLAKKDCEGSGGGGGGAGYGGGGGGAWKHYGFDFASGGGGAGLAPDTGVTLWASMSGPPNAKDADYESPSGAADHDGLVVISWPAPNRSAFMKAIKPYAPQRVVLSESEPTPTSASCSLKMDNPKKLKDYFPVIEEGNFDENGNFRATKIYKGFRDSALDFDTSDISRLEVKRNVPMLVFAEFDGKKARFAPCGTAIDSDAIGEHPEFAGVLAEAATYSAALGTKQSPDAVPKEGEGNDDIYAKAQDYAKKYDDVVKVLRENNDYLHLLEFARQSVIDIVKYRWQIPNKRDIHYSMEMEAYVRDKKKPQEELCQYDTKPGSDYFPDKYVENLYDAVVDGSTITATFKAGFGAEFQKSVLDFSTALAAIRDIRGALAGLCRFDSPPLYVTVARALGRDDLVNGRISYLGNISHFNLGKLFLRGLNASGTEWSDVNVGGADLVGANFQSAKLRDVNLEDAKLYLATYDCETEFPPGFDPVEHRMIFSSNQECDQNTPPQGVDLRGLDIRPLYKHDLTTGGTGDLNDSVVFNYSQLSHIEAVGATLGRILCAECTITNSDFSKADVAFTLQGAKISNTSFKGAVFRKASWRDVTLTNVDFTGADLSAINVTNCTYDDKTKWPKGFKPRLIGFLRPDEQHFINPQ